MATLKDFRDERIKKLEKIQGLGINPFPAKSNRTATAGEVVADFATLENTTQTVDGRIKSIRTFGKLVFIGLQDASGKVQLFVKDGTIGQLDPAKGELGLAEIPLLDTGDFVEATGKVIKTKTGEISISVEKLRLLTKSLRPMPLEHEEFSDKEERLRRRYIDININQAVRERFVRRGKFWKACREFLQNRGFVEMNIPVLEHTTGGADANPFVTHMDALDQDFYLRISHELPLKRLLGAGYEKIYDIGPRFRNEGMTEEHLPEHNAIEWYWAYADWQDGMKLTEELVRYIADQVWGKRKFKLLDGTTVDLGQDGESFPMLSFPQLIKDNYDIDVFDTNIEQVAAKLKDNGLEVEKSDSIARGVDKLWKKIRKQTPGPAFLVDIPVYLQPLAKKQAKDPRLTEQFNLILGGTEACKAYSELNDPVDQLGRFVEQQDLRNSGDAEAMMMDIDFVEMLEYGMPPACGYGHSERLFWLLEGVTAREGVIFPQMRQEVSEVTKSIYGDVSFGAK
jgi:lysyl-tRNA synthetase class 2